MKGAWLVIRALWELARYEVVIRLFGFRGVVRSAARRRRRAASPDPEFESQACEAMNWALSVYWKRVFCLQRSVAMTRVLLSGGLDAHLVIGCRPNPFASHAWVEIDGRVLNDSPSYRRLLTVLERI